MTSLKRKIVNHGFTGLSALALAVALVPLVSITWYVVKRGAPVISWDFLTNLPTTPDDPASGIGPAIQGTGIVVLLAAIIGLPIGILAGMWLSEHARGSKLGYWFRLAMDAMAATPSIVMGIFVYTVVVLAQGHFSALAAGIALGLMVVPVVARTAEVSLLAIPSSLREAGIALGATNTRTMFRVTLPAAQKGVITGSILALARVAGETAPLLFTALFFQYWADSIDKPIAALPTLILRYIEQPYAQLQEQAWGAAFLLFVLVFGANVIVRILARVGGRGT